MNEIISDVSNMKPTHHFCNECDATFENSSKYARHLYAHTFIKKEDEDMPCICTTCGQDFTGTWPMSSLDLKKSAVCLHF